MCSSLPFRVHSFTLQSYNLRSSTDALIFVLLARERGNQRLGLLFDDSSTLEFSPHIASPGTKFVEVQVPGKNLFIFFPGFLFIFFVHSAAI